MTRDSRDPSRPPRMAVAGVELSIHAGFPLISFDDPPYESFQHVGAPDSGRPADIDVEVLVDPCPVSGAPMVFDSEFAWHMQREGSDYRVSYRRNDSEKVHTVFCADQDTTRMRFFRDGFFVVQGDNATVTDGQQAAADILGVVTAVERDGRRVWFGAGRWGRLVALAARRKLVRRFNRVVRLKYALHTTRIRGHKGDDGNE